MRTPGTRSTSSRCQQLPGHVLGEVGAFALVMVVLLSLACPGRVLAQEGTESPSPAVDAVAEGTGFGQNPAPQPGLAQTGSTTAVANDPPARVVRVSLLNGDVSTEPASVNTFSPAELNQVLTSGDRIYTDPAAQAELQAGQMAVRLGGGTDLTVSAMTDSLAQFGLAAGSVHVRSFAIDPGTVLELDSPEAAVTVLQPGDLRVDVDPATHTTAVSLDSGQVQVDGPGMSQVLTPGQRLRIHGGDPESGQAPYTEPLAPASADGLDSFSDARDSLYASGSDAAGPYLSPDTVGGADLAAYGSWGSGDSGDSGGAGPVWFPVVAVGWQPYCFGHWRWIPPWGWTWVGNEPWGFAPFHYGRWSQFGGRWGWIPGSRAVRPVYAPALVAFAGGAQFSRSLGYAPGLGITAWFPLGPREPYAPWYHGSTLYVNRVNASNIYDPNAAEVRGFYNQRAVNVFTGAGSGTSGSPGSLANRAYANRLTGTVAVLQTSFAAGRPVGNASLHIPAETLAAAPILPHPTVAPDRSMLVPRVGTALPAMLTRPALGGRSSADDLQPAVAGVTFFHRAEPPQPGPSFEQQRQAMETVDPGRPLSPGQMENLRGNRPAGTAPRELIPHPSTTRSAPPPPAPARSAPPAPAATSPRH